MHKFYLLKNKGEIVYVGRTDNIKRRMCQHKSERKKVYDSYEIAYEIEYLQVACRAEDFLIKKYTPKYNRATNEHGWFVHYDEIKDHFNLEEDILDEMLWSLRINPIFKEYYKQITIIKLEEKIYGIKRVFFCKKEAQRK